MPRPAKTSGRGISQNRKYGRAASQRTKRSGLWYSRPSPARARQKARVASPPSVPITTRIIKAAPIWSSSWPKGVKKLQANMAMPIIAPRMPPTAPPQAAPSSARFAPRPILPRAGSLAPG